MTILRSVLPVCEPAIGELIGDWLEDCYDSTEPEIAACRTTGIFDNQRVLKSVDWLGSDQRRNQKKRSKSEF